MPRRTVALVLLVALALAACARGDDDESRAAAETTTTVTVSTTEPTVPPEPTAVPTTEPRGPTVGAIGDSLLFQVKDELSAALGGLELYVRSAPGLSFDDVSFYLRRMEARRPEALVMVLGTNNATDGLDDGDAAGVERIARLLSWAPCLRWVTVVDTYASDRWNEAARAINAELAQEADRRASLGLVPWAEAVRDHPEYIDPDGLHHSAAGRTALSEMITAAVRTCPSLEGPSA